MHAMWFRNILRRNSPSSSSSNSQRRAPAGRRQRAVADEQLFDENFLRRLERLSLQAQRTLRGHPSSGEHLSRRQLPTSIFSDHRPYTYGDDLRYVDWNAYARHDHILLKLGETEQDVDIHLLLDCSRSMAWGQPTKLRTAQQLVGALGYLALAHSDRLRVAPFGATPLPQFGPAQGKGRLIEMLRYIEALPVQPQTSLGPMIDQYARQHPRGGMLVLCSDLLAPEGLTEGLRRLTPPRWQVLVLHMLDQRELRPELTGPIELEDYETGERLQVTLDDELLADYRQRVGAWQEQLAQACGRRGATYARVLAHWPLEQKIVPFLRARRLLR